MKPADNLFDKHRGAGQDHQSKDAKLGHPWCLVSKLGSGKLNLNPRSDVVGASEEGRDRLGYLAQLLPQ